jgi:hypothetical protein
MTGYLEGPRPMRNAAPAEKSRGTRTLTVGLILLSYRCTCSPPDMPKGLGRGYLLMASTKPFVEPAIKRAVTFFDGQNL